ncbi:metalloprotease [Lasiosphaeria hispida]|uniref:Metalloprotease n=1 Tax=Lasiosphaeria hispida TaxID=260671 RepID=A0AAJ0MDL8_9PEZI|nr:metalloprotease [Lasiosphaeria hispida]
MEILAVLKWFAVTLAYTISAHVVLFREEPEGIGNWCGTVATPEWLAEDYKRVDVEERIVPRQSSITVDTYFHVVANSTRVRDGYLTDQMLSRQLDTLNADYAASYISFNLRGITRTVNRTWALSTRLQDQVEMKKSLRRGTYSTLNVYFRTNIGESDEGGTLLGQCTLPKPASEVPPGSNNFYRDGCMVLYDTVLVGGTTTTHEVGHWFGLLHTFEGGCTGPGDMVADTPAEASPSGGCNLLRNTCPDQPGYDPVENFMDYSPSSCRKTFTPGQSARMWGRWNTLRA